MRYIFLILLFLPFLLFGQTNTGFQVPTATGEDFTAFANPAYGYATDDNYASLNYADYPGSQDYYNFDLSVPTDATIDSIGIMVEIMQNDANPYYVHCGIELSWDGGGTYTTSGVYDSTSTSYIDQTKYKYSTFGRSWSGSEFSNTNFRVKITFDATYAGGPWYSYLDQVRACVYYTSSGSYSPVAGRDYKVYKAGVEKKPLKDGLVKYFRRKGSAPAATEPIIIFAEDFETVSTIDQTQFELWNMNTGWWYTPDVYISTATDHGNVMRVDFHTNDTGDPIANNKFMLDSVYHDIYFQYDICTSSGFDFGSGGKTFGSFAGGNEADIPYDADTINSGFNTMVLFNAGGNMSWYHYTHNANGFATTLTETVNMPAPAHAGTWVLGRDYLWSKDGSFGGGWYAWPTRTTWNPNNSKWEYASEPWLSLIPVASWVTITQRIRLSSGGNHDIWAMWRDGICVYSKDDNRYRIMDNINQGVESLYINSFFGGTQPSPKEQYWLIDNLVAYVLPAGNSEYSDEAPYLTSTITPMTPSTKYVTTQAMPKDETYTDETGTVYSHNHAFNWIPSFVTVNKIIHSTGATSYSCTMTQYTAQDSYLAETNRNYVKIYSYSGGVATLRRTYDTDNPTLGVTTVTCDSIRIEYYTGNGKTPKLENGWTMTYTTVGGSGTGNNPVYPAAADMVATKP